MLITELNKKLFTLKYTNIKNYLVVGEKTCIKMSQSKDTVEFIKKRKRNDKKDGQDQVLSFQELKSHFDKNLRLLITELL